MPNEYWQTYLQFRVRCNVLFWHLYCFYFVQVLRKKWYTVLHHMVTAICVFDFSRCVVFYKMPLTLGSSVRTCEWNKDKADIGLTFQFGVMLDNFILRTLFNYILIHLDRENFKEHFTKERISLYYFYDWRYCRYVNLIGSNGKNIPELSIPFLTALDNCLLCFSEYLKFISDCVGICRILYVLCYTLFFCVS
jgi:hypothetical protein